MSNSLLCPTILLERARVGESEALNCLLEMYRNYLQLLVRTQIGPDLNVRFDASDVVRETLMEACDDFPQFNGTTERQLRGWLRAILAHNLANLIKHHRAQKRDLNRHRSLEDELDRSGMKIDRVLADSVSSPSVHASRRERAVIVADASARLPADYRDVIVMRRQPLRWRPPWGAALITKRGFCWQCASAACDGRGPAGRGIGQRFRSG